MSQSILHTTEQGHLRIIINRPKALNALNSVLIQDLHALLQKHENDEEVRVVSIEGSGEKAFAAGADITEFQGISAAAAEKLSRAGQACFTYISAYPKPVIAMIRGYALGGGLELAMSCHTRIASSSAMCGLPEINLGLLPGYAGTQRLSQLIGISKANYLAITGEMIDATEAHSAGLVAKVIADDDWAVQSAKILSKLSKKAPLATRAILKTMMPSRSVPDADMAAESKAFGHLMDTEDLKEGVSAFLEKRKAVFTGK